jgi:hypothetical protein
VFISKATPGDDEFVLWLAPRLEAAGYTVFADILNLEGGTRWRKEVTNTLQTRSIKMLLCCRDSTLAKEGVQEEIGIAGDLVKELSDPKLLVARRGGSVRGTTFRRSMPSSTDRQRRVSLTRPGEANCNQIIR